MSAVELPIAATKLEEAKATTSNGTNGTANNGDKKSTDFASKAGLARMLKGTMTFFSITMMNKC